MPRTEPKGLPLFLLRNKDALKKLAHYDQLLHSGQEIGKFSAAEYDSWGGFVIAARSAERALEIAEERASHGLYHALDEVRKMRAVVIADSSHFRREGIVIEDFQAG